MYLRVVALEELAQRQVKLAAEAVEVANAGRPRRHALAVESNMPTAAASALHVLDNHSVTLAKVPVTRAVEDCVCYVRKIWTLRGGARLGEKHRKMFAFFGQPFVRATPPRSSRT